jgi:hypothetical protein
LEAAGAQLLVLECVPAALAKTITDALQIPVIGIGAGKDTDGQILVMHDALGITGGHTLSLRKTSLQDKVTFAQLFVCILKKWSRACIRLQSIRLTNSSASSIAPSSGRGIDHQFGEPLC